MNSITFFSTTQALLLVIALSMDAFISSFAYGTNKIKIPFKSVTIINVVCSSILFIALILGNVLSRYIPNFITLGISFSILMILGIIKIYQGYKGEKPIEGAKGSSKTLSPVEAFSLAVAVSLDGLAAGFGAGIVGVNYIEIVLFSLISDMVAVMLGCNLGNKIAHKTKFNLSWLSGGIFIILAIVKLI